MLFYRILYVMLKTFALDSRCLMNVFESKTIYEDYVHNDNATIHENVQALVSEGYEKAITAQSPGVSRRSLRPAPVTKLMCHELYRLRY